MDIDELLDMDSDDQRRRHLQVRHDLTLSTYGGGHVGVLPRVPAPVTRLVAHAVVLSARFEVAVTRLRASRSQENRTGLEHLAAG